MLLASILCKLITNEFRSANFSALRNELNDITLNIFILFYSIILVNRFLYVFSRYLLLIVIIVADETQEVALIREVVTAHSVFPTCICLVGLSMFDLLEDSESYNGTTGN